MVDKITKNNKMNHCFSSGPDMRSQSDMRSQWPGNKSHTPGNRSHTQMSQSSNFQSSNLTQNSNLQCFLCGRISSNAGNLQKHLRIHTGERPYSCKLCHRTFNDRSSITRHIKTIHKVPNVPNFVHVTNKATNKDSIQRASTE